MNHAAAVAALIFVPAFLLFLIKRHQPTCTLLSKLARAASDLTDTYNDQYALDDSDEEDDVNKDN